MQNVTNVERHAVNNGNLINLQKITKVHSYPSCRQNDKTKQKQKLNDLKLSGKKIGQTHTKKSDYQNKTGSRNKEGKGSNTSTKQR